MCRSAIEFAFIPEFLRQQPESASPQRHRKSLLLKQFLAQVAWVVEREGGGPDFGGNPKLAGVPHFFECQESR
jgi:hypothetical protein